MEAFFSFPPEIQTHVLCFLSQHELTTLFDLSEAVQNKRYLDTVAKTMSSDFFTLQLQALFAMFHKKPLSLSNDFARKSMPLFHLKKILDMGVNITPSSVNISVCDFTDYEGSFSFWDCFSPSLFAFLKRLNSRINIELVVWENTPLDQNMLKSWFEPLIKNEISVASCKIKYSSSDNFLSANHGTDLHTHERMKDLDFLLSRGLETERLHFNFLGASKISQQLLSTNFCFHLQNVQYIDLSYNQLTEFDLRSVTFPKSLKSLNLSNNAFSVLEDEIINFKHLPCLRELNISNNNIMRLDICQSSPSSIEILNLSGNFLTTYSQVFEGDLFANLRTLDLSHNLIGEVTNFPTTLLKVNLYGNYINAQTDLASLSIPAHLEIQGIDHFLLRSVAKKIEVDSTIFGECKA